jgi:hypothetical protein
MNTSFQGKRMDFTARLLPPGKRTVLVYYASCIAGGIQYGEQDRLGLADQKQKLPPGQSR